VEGWFFVGEDEEVCDEPGDGCVLDEVRAAEEQGLAEDDCYDGYVHWVSEVSVEALDYEVAGSEYGCGGSDA
jgi:hypothetical protein